MILVAIISAIAGILGTFFAHRVGHRSGKAFGYRRGYDAGWVDREIKIGKDDRARRQKNGQFKGRNRR